jgi:hypothetical protein
MGYPVGWTTEAGSRRILMHELRLSLAAALGLGTSLAFAGFGLFEPARGLP